MNTLNQQSLIEVVNQRNNKPTDGIPGDRNSVLGNPFDMQRNERLRDPVCDAHEAYFDAVIAGEEPVPTATRIAKARGLNLASAWKRPSRQAFMGELEVLEQRQKDGKPSKLMCWCYPSRCHLDKDKAYLDNQREKALQAPTEVFEAMPEPPTRTQTPFKGGAQALASPDRITSLAPNQVFVFGSNTQGRHGKGAALRAVAFGAEYGNPRGRQGQTYAIVTKDLTFAGPKEQRSVPLEHVEQQINGFLDHAIAHPETEFLVTRFGCDLAGYTEQEIGNLWVGKAVPPNVRLPQAFLNVLQSSAAIAPETLTTGGVEAMPEAASTALAQPKTYNPLRDLAPLNPRVAYPMQKDVAMAGIATQFIGRSAAPASTPSSTRNYEREWAKLGRSNTGVYTPEDVVMVSGSGPWRGVTQAQIQQTFQQHYEPLLETVVKAQATVVVGSAQGTDQLVKQWLQTRGYKLSAEDGYMKAEPPLVKEKAIAILTTDGRETLTATPTSLVVLSGGQTGADLGGLKAGKALGLQTGGTAPHGWLVERCARFSTGRNPGLADYGLVEGPQGRGNGHTYLLRTELNVQNSDGTLVLGSIDPVQDKGSYRTVELAEKHGKPCLHIGVTDLFKRPNETVLQIKDWVLKEGIETLNVAGNRESKCVGLEDRVETVLKVALAEVVRVRTENAREQTTNSSNDIDLPTPLPARYLIYADAECCPEPEATDVQTRTCAFTQKALQEAQKRGYERVEIIVATLNTDPVNLECLQPLVAAAQTGVSQTQSSSTVAGNTPFQAEVYESPDAAIDLLDLEGNPDNRLILMSNGKGLGTKQMVEQAEQLGVKVVGYNPEKQTYIGAPQPQAAVKTAVGKGSKGTGR